MLFQGVDAAKNGIHLWIDRKSKYRTQIEAMMKSNADGQAKAGVAVNADKHWVIVKPEDIQ